MNGYRKKSEYTRCQERSNNRSFENVSFLQKRRETASRSVEISGRGITAVKRKSNFEKFRYENGTIPRDVHVHQSRDVHVNRDARDNVYNTRGKQTKPSGWGRVRWHACNSTRSCRPTKYLAGISN